GLTYALKTAKHFPEKRITVISKSEISETNTKYAQGGVAAVNNWQIDTFEKHVEDTLVAGDGLCKENIVNIVVKEGTERVDEIIELGAQFDKDKTGNYV